MKEKLGPVGRYEMLAEPFHCDFAKSLFIGHLGNHMLNAADFHSTDRGFGMNYLNTVHKTWVLSRLTIEMESLPKAYDRFAVETWVESAMRFFTSRNFKVTDAQDESCVYGYGRSIWAMIDTRTRQPQNILEVKDGSILNWVEKDKVCPIDKPSRVQMKSEGELIAEVPTHYSDVDVNGHINSVKYIEHILDLFPLEYHKTHPLKRIDIAYVAESLCGHLLLFYEEKVEDNKFDIFNIRVVRRRKDDEDTEVCRCRVEFM